MEQLALYYYIVYAVLMVGTSFYSIHLFSTRGYLVDNSKRSKTVLFIVLLLLMVFCATGDYWSYRIWYDTGVENMHFEPIWETIRKLIPWGFDIFKLLLWGAGLILFSLMCEWHNSDKLIAYTLFVLFYTSNYSYARASVAFMFILFSYYLLIRIIDTKVKRLPLLLIIIVFIVLGIQMHRSMPMLLAILAISLFIKPRKQTFILLLVFFPVVSIAFNTIFYPYIISYVSTDEDTARLMQLYLHEDSRGISVFIKQLIEYIPLLLLFLVSLVNILKQKNLPNLVKKIAISAFFIVYCAFLFYTIREGNGLALFYRTMNMAYPFMLLSIAYSMKHINSMYNLTLIVLVFKISLTLLGIYQVLGDPSYLYRQVFERYI